LIVLEKNFRVEEIEKREAKEAEVFDQEALHEFRANSLEDIRDEDLLITKERISMHLNFRSPPQNAYRYAIYQLRNLTGKTILDYCCGSGESAVIIAKKRPQFIEAFDISPSAVRLAERRMKINNVDQNVRVRKMSAYAMEYESNYFDVIYGNAVLHHLDMQVAMNEIVRVLKPGGMAIFCEPFSGSGILESIRKLVPIKGGISPYERQLSFDDVKVVTRCFSSSHVHFFEVFSRADRIITNQLFCQKINWFDAKILEALKWVRKFARTIVIKAIR